MLVGGFTLFMLTPSLGISVNPDSMTTPATESQPLIGQSPPLTSAVAMLLSSQLLAWEKPSMFSSSGGPAIIMRAFLAFLMSHSPVSLSVAAFLMAV